MRSTSSRTHSCPFSLPVSLEPRVGSEQLLGPDVWIVEVDAHAQVATFTRHGPDDAAAEFAVTDPFAFDVARRVLRHLFRKSDVRQTPRRRPARPRRAWRHRARTAQRLPRGRRAALLDHLRRQRIEEARRLRKLQATVAVARARP